MDRQTLFERMMARKVQGHVHYIPIPMHPFYKTQFNIEIDQYEQALAYYREAITIPLYPTMTDGDVETVIATVQELIG